jgi:hypothetical protein
MNVGVPRMETNVDYSWGGWLDEIRVSKGIARWTANFTPPASPYGLGGGFSGGQPWIF